MPRVPDASMATTFARVAATFTPDPTIKSRTFVAPVKQGNLISIVRASDVGQDITPTKSVLAIPRWISPQFKGRFFLK